MNQGVRPPPQYAAALEKLLTGDSNSFYKITVSGTTYSGLTQNAYSFKNFYYSSMKKVLPIAHTQREGFPSGRTEGLGIG